MEIKFSHNYPKLHGQKSAELIAVRTCNRADMPEDFIEYDTRYVDSSSSGFFPLPDGAYMVLVFLGDSGIPFTTVRRFTDEKYRYYKSNLGVMFDIAIKPESQP